MFGVFQKKISIYEYKHFKIGNIIIIFIDFKILFNIIFTFFLFFSFYLFFEQVEM